MECCKTCQKPGAYVCTQCTNIFYCSGKCKHAQKRCKKHKLSSILVSKKKPAPNMEENNASNNKELLEDANEMKNLENKFQKIKLEKINSMLAHLELELLELAQCTSRM